MIFVEKSECVEVMARRNVIQAIKSSAAHHLENSIRFYEVEIVSPRLWSITSAVNGERMVHMSTYFLIKPGIARHNLKMAINELVTKLVQSLSDHEQLCFNFSYHEKYSTSRIL